jgi:tetratricopeptide (TPR) repeat protein
MRRVGWVAVLALGVTACGVDRQEKVRGYTEDGLHLYQCGDYRHARLDFEAALKLAPGDVTLEYDIAQCWDRLGRDDKAEPLYRDCLQRDANNPDCWHALVVLLVRQGRRDEAVTLVQGWLAAKPNLSSPYVEDAYLWRAFGDVDKALARLERACELDGKDYRARVALAMLYEDLHFPDRAVVLYEKALAINPNQPDVAQHLAALRTQGVPSPRP